MEEAIQYAKKYLEDLLSFYGLNIEVHATAEDDVIELSVPSTHMNGFLIGQRGETMRSLQYVTSMSLKSKGYEHTRVNIDVADYKKNRNDRLAERAEEWINQVKSTGKQLNLNPMSASDRRIVHKVAGENGLATESVGEGRDRHIILKPVADDGSEAPDPTTDESPAED